MGQQQQQQQQQEQQQQPSPPPKKRASLGGPKRVKLPPKAAPGTVTAAPVELVAE